MPRALLAAVTLFAVGLDASLSDEPRWGRPACGIFGMGALREADGGGGSSQAAATTPAAGAPPATQAPPAPVQEAPKLDAAKIAKEAKAAARAEFLKDAGHDSEESWEAEKAARKKEADAKLSESERLTKAFEASEKANAKAATKLAEAQAERDAARTELTLMKGGIHADQVDVAAYLHSKAKAEEGFDEAKWIVKLRAEKPYLFGSAAASPDKPAATTSAQSPPGGSAFGAPPAVSPAGVADANAMTPAQWAAFKANGCRVLPHTSDSGDRSWVPSFRTSLPTSSTSFRATACRAWCGSRWV